MYVPNKFRIDDPDTISNFIKANPFGLLLTQAGSAIHDTHTPFVHCRQTNRLIGHIARANPQWKSWNASTNAKIIFSGPHAYISPQYYASDFNVPTWNYTAASVSGSLTVMDETEESLNLLDTLVADNERGPSPWTFDRQDDRYLKMLSAIVVFSVAMDHVDVSFKLNQNRSEADQQSVINELKKSQHPDEQAIAALMVSNLNKQPQDRRQ